MSQPSPLARPDPSRGILYLTLVCLVATLGGLLFGYDTAVISGAIGFLQTHFQLDPAAEGWAAACALFGCCIGAGFAGVASDRFGRRNTLAISAVLFLVSAVGTAIPRAFEVFILFRIVGGIGIGAASMTSPMYIAEISPPHLRGRMVSVNQLAIVTGMLLVYLVNYAIAQVGATITPHGIPAADSWNVTSGWRWMFASGAAPSLLLLGLLLVVPESPRWQAAKGRAERALATLSRINGPARAATELAEIEEALRRERASDVSIHHPAMRGPLLAGVGLAVLQQVTGINVFLYYAPEIFKGLAGARVDAALLQTVVVGAVNLLFTIVAIVTVDRLGRRPLMLLGATGMGICLAGIGLAAGAGSLGPWLLALMLGYIACFALSVGPVTWVILSEIFPTRIRGRAMAIATVALWLANFVVSQTFPMLDKNPVLHAHVGRGFPFFLYAAFCVFLVLLVAFRIPETRGRSLEEIERHWSPGAPADRDPAL